MERNLKKLQQGIKKQTSSHTPLMMMSCDNNCLPLYDNGIFVYERNTALLRKQAILYSMIYRSDK